MATLTTPGSGYANNDKFVEAKLIAMGAKPASTDSEIQTIAMSKLAPGEIVTGGTTGTAGAGTLATPTRYQAITNTAAMGKGARYDEKGNINTNPVPSTAPNTPSVPSTTGADTGSGTSAGTGLVNIPSGILSADEYQKQYGPKPVDEAAIREQVRSAQQAQIDSVNAVYEDMLRGQGRVNDSNMGSTRAINARSGLLGSDFGNANMSNQASAGEQANKAILRERDVKISSILADIDSTVASKVAAQKAEALGNANAYKDYLDKAQTKAATWITNLGKSGETVDHLKETAPEQLKQILASSGMSETELMLAMNAARPPKEKIDWKTDVKGNHVIVYGTDPVTGQLQYHTQELPADAAANEVKVVDGEIWSISPDGTGATKIGGPGKPAATKIVGKVLYQQQQDGSWKPAVSGANNTPIRTTPTGNTITKKLTPAQQTQASKDNVIADIGAIRGSDNFLDTAKFAQIRDGIKMNDPTLLGWFDSTFKKDEYLNPNDPTNF